MIMCSDEVKFNRVLFIARLHTKYRGDRIASKSLYTFGTNFTMPCIQSPAQWHLTKIERKQQ